MSGLQPPFQALDIYFVLSNHALPSICYVSCSPVLVMKKNNKTESNQVWDQVALFHWHFLIIFFMSVFVLARDRCQRPPRPQMLCPGTSRTPWRGTWAPRRPAEAGAGSMCQSTNVASGAAWSQSDQQVHQNRWCRRRSLWTPFAPLGQLARRLWRHRLPGHPVEATVLGPFPGSHYYPFYRKNRQSRKTKASEHPILLRKIRERQPGKLPGQKGE